MDPGACYPSTDLAVNDLTICDDWESHAVCPQVLDDVTVQKRDEFIVVFVQQQH